MENNNTYRIYWSKGIEIVNIKINDVDILAMNFTIAWKKMEKEE